MSVIEVHDPATLAHVADVPDQTPEDGAAAVDRASAALLDWAHQAPRLRSEVLDRAHRMMLRDRESLAALISTENGKSLADADAEVRYAAEFFRWYAEEAVRIDGEFREAPDGGSRIFVTHRPVGVAALVTPWNFPAAMVTRKIAPAIAAGCSAVLKPAPETPLTALAIAALLTEAGLPYGVVNVVTTSDAAGVVGGWLADHRVRALSFTGSTGVGRHLLHQAADRIVNASMELGGNAPFVVTGDADLDAAVDGALLAKFRGGGQACTAANRFFVHTDVHDEFVDRLCEQVAALRIGAAAEGADLGPLISASAVARIEGQSVMPSTPAPELRSPAISPTSRATSPRHVSSSTSLQPRPSCVRNSSGQSRQSSRGPTRRRWSPMSTEPTWGSPPTSTPAN